METETTWVEVEMSWVGMDEAGWRWVRGLVILEKYCIPRQHRLLGQATKQKLSNFKP